MAVNCVRVNNNANVDDFNENERNSEDDDNDDADYHDYGGGVVDHGENDGDGQLKRDCAIYEAAFNKM